MNSYELRELTHCALDPWYFIRTHIKTQDPSTGITQFPDYPFLRDFVQSLQINPRLLIPKSRQMTITWTVLSYFLWLALFRTSGIYLYISRSERCAEELLARTRFLVEHLPAYMQPKLISKSREQLSFEGIHSRILSLAAIPDAPRMYSPSGVFWDELAFTPFAEDIWAALLPSLQSGGIFVGVSTSNGPTGLLPRLLANPEHHACSVFPVHYKSHPLRGPNWVAQAKKGMSASKWDREMEISFESMTDVIYNEFDATRHILKTPYLPDITLPIYRSIDFGYRHPFVLWLQSYEILGDSLPQITVFAEWSGKDVTLETVIKHIKSIDEYYHLNETQMLWTSCDPAGAQVRDIDISPVNALERDGFKLSYRQSTITSGIDIVKSYLLSASGENHLTISPNCVNLIRHIQSYRWSPTPDQPLKDGICDHSMDALRYFFVNLETAVSPYPSPRIRSGQEPKPS